MAEVTVTGIVNLRITDAEWRLIMKSLAAFAGLKIKPAKDEQKKAEALNKDLLFQRRADLRDQLEVAEAAFARAEGIAIPPPSVDPEDPDGSAGVSRMAFEVGKQVERRKQEDE